MKINAGLIKDLLRETLNDWLQDNAPRLGAALAFYSILSIGPLILLVLAAAGLVFGREAAEARIMNQIGDLIGPQGAGAIQEMILAAANHQQTGFWATLIGLAVLLFGASGVFSELQGALNTIWEVKARPEKGLWGFIKNRFFSLTIVLGTGFLLLISLIISAVLSAAGDYTIGLFSEFVFIMKIINFIISFSVITFLFALTFKVLPDVEIAWKDVWVGAIITAILFTAGKFAIGFYLGHSAIASGYGAAGSLIVLLVWVYYSAQISLFGAEFTQVYANRFGSRIVPARDAVFLANCEKPDA